MEKQDKLFYDKDGIIVRHSRPEDIEYLKDHLRQSDVDELWASAHHTANEALKNSYENAVLSLTIVNENPVGMFGITPQSMIGYKASVWFLATAELEKINKRFAKNSRRFIDLMLMYYPYLFNYVDDRNTKSIKWLRICGAEISDPKPYGKEQLPFRFFCFQRDLSWMNGGKDHV